MEECIIIIFPTGIYGGVSYREVWSVRGGGGERLRLPLGAGHHALESAPVKPAVRQTHRDTWATPVPE